MVDTKQLTTGERLVIQRHRAEETQAAAASRYGVPHGVYGRWERDQTTAYAAPRVSVGTLQLHEKCLVARLRAGKRQVDIAHEMGHCPYWVGQMERGRIDAGRLAQHLGVV